MLLSVSPLLGSAPVGSAPEEMLQPPVLVAQCAVPEASPPVFAGSVPAGSVPVGSAPDEVLHPPVLVAQCAEPEASPPVFAGSVPAGAPVVPVVSPLMVDVCPVESVAQVPVPVWHPA
ncbi:MAG: hypothetical protein QOG57_5084 [Pseudonocardiales bacterium]|nr:hypothetical protein [Pseudonocardiales bacterium]